MYSKLCVLAVVAPLISALTLNAPTEAVTSSGPIHLTWTSVSSDEPVFSLELVNEQFHDTFAIANNVQTSAGSITITLPSVPVDRQYTVEAVNISNVNDVFATTGSFNIGPPASSSAASSATSKGSGNSSGASGPTMSALPPVGGSSASFGVTVSNTAPGATAPTSSTGTSSGASGPTGTNFNSGLPVRLNVNKGFMASAMLSLVAGAAVVAL